MVSKKLFLNPNNDDFINVSKFWTAFTNWIQGTNFDFELVDEGKWSYFNGEKKLDIDWENLYREYYGKSVPFTIAMFNESNWEDIKEFITLMYMCVIRNDKKDLFEHKINEYLRRFTVQYIFLKGEFVSSDYILEQPVVKAVLDWIDLYPDASKAYHSALNKISDGIYVRNAIDDMRLSLESLIRCLTGTSKTLENQIKPLGVLLKGKGVPPQTINMITTMITYYTKYQNDYVKHHDSVNKDDLEMIVNMTVNIMKYIRERLA